MPDAPSPALHATAVALHGRGLLIQGASGSGKSSLALDLMAMGARLVADDRVIVTERDGALWLSCPSPLRGLIEARGLGLLRADPIETVALHTIVDLDHPETERMPHCREIMLQGHRIPLLQRPSHTSFPAALIQYLKGGRGDPSHMNDQRTGSQRVVLVTGPSGAGRSTAINALEDIGFEAIDNIPLSLIPRLIEGGALDRPVALGIDIRNRDFSVSGLLDLHRGLGAQPQLEVQLLYVDCSPDVLARRYSETRRRHPMAPDESYTQGIARELELLGDARSSADLLIDTSELSPHDLRAQLETWFADATGQRMAISLHSFSYKRGIPQGLDWVFDCRFLDNPHWEPALRGLTGLDAPVTEYIGKDTRFAPFIAKLTELALFVLPACKDEGKAHLSFGFGCTGGQHRSVAVTETVSAALAEQGWQVSSRHRELERRGLSAHARDGKGTGGKTA
ncbi:hypothetical protein GCM10011415_11980 [Salipiger pallidus]|uniref:Nucleotide-binding protein n=2 Tax=Salipiger pallidus TaxID=1775170 RepID=A0A8J3EFT6_9RHOB|nr:hypothetical protein GCM10011415_11980 [Salipiger pallidus]